MVLRVTAKCGCQTAQYQLLVKCKCSRRKWHKIHVGKLRGSVCFIRRDLIGGHRGGFKSGGKRWLPISALPMTGQMQMFEGKMA